MGKVGAKSSYVWIYVRSLVCGFVLLDKVSHFMDQAREERLDMLSVRLERSFWRFERAEYTNITGSSSKFTRTVSAK
jgi:hypothetical protein